MLTLNVFEHRACCIIPANKDRHEATHALKLKSRCDHVISSSSYYLYLVIFMACDVLSL